MKKIVLLIVVVLMNSCGGGEKKLSYKDCRLDENCWNIVFTDIIDEMEKDLSDGILDDDYLWDSSRIFNTVENISSYEVKHKIWDLFIVRYKKLSKENKKVVDGEILFSQRYKSTFINE